MVRCAAVLYVVVMVGAQVRVHAAFAQQLGHRIVERLERAPRRMQKVQPARVQLPARRHARQRADKVAVECDGPLGKARKIRQCGAVGPAIRQQVEPQGIEHHHDGAHQTAPFLPDFRLFPLIFSSSLAPARCGALFLL